MPTPPDPAQTTTMHDILTTIGFGALLTAVVSAAITTRGKHNDRRRAAYGEMTAALASWAELPYRIRRRTSDDPATLAALTEQIHELQETLVCQKAALRAESRWLADERDRAETEIRTLTAPYIVEAWNTPPTTAAKDMVINDWGPTGTAAIIEQFTQQLRWRFGIRRLWAPIRGWRRRHKKSKTA